MEESKLDNIIVYVNELRAEARSDEIGCCRAVKQTIIRRLEDILVFAE